MQNLAQWFLFFVKAEQTAEKYGISAQLFAFPFNMRKVLTLEYTLTQSSY